MGTSTNDRVKKHRDKKKDTPKGLEELRAKNREYAARSRAKKEIKRLTEEKTVLKNVLGLSPEEFQDIDNQVERYATSIRERDNSSQAESTVHGSITASNATDDEKRKIELKVLRWEIKLLKKTAKKDVMDTVGVLLNLKKVGA